MAAQDISAEAFEAFFETAYDPQYVRTLDGTRFLRVNQAFEALVGHSKEACESGTVTPESLIHPEASERYAKQRLEWNERDESRYDLEILTGDGRRRTVEFAVRRIQLDGRAVVLGSARDVTERRQLEEQLKDEIAIQRRKTIEAAKASVRIWQLTEKIRNVPRLAEALLDAPDEATLLAKAGAILTDADGLNYAQVAIYVIEADQLVRRWPQEAPGRKRYGMAKGSAHAKVARGEGEITPEPGAVILPLRGHDAILGVVEVHFDEDERILFDSSQSVRSGQLDIVRTLANSLGLMLASQRLLEQVHQQTIRDELTGVFNRRFLDRKVRDEVRRAKRYKRPMSVLMLDLDKFKQVNDTLGHAQGDETLRELARVLRGQTRDVDVVCRYGGDEFTMLLPETEADAALRKAERLREKVAEFEFRNLSDAGRPLKFTLSVGVAALGEDVPDEGELLKRADEALYRSKRDGRNRVTMHGA
jgi:diguanylate cyclase (GGDEF)-like protein/PAS domain S-box-containing protein